MSEIINFTKIIIGSCKFMQLAIGNGLNIDSGVMHVRKKFGFEIRIASNNLYTYHFLVARKLHKLQFPI